MARRRMAASLRDGDDSELTSNDVAVFNFLSGSVPVNKGAVVRMRSCL